MAQTTELHPLSGEALLARDVGTAGAETLGFTKLCGPRRCTVLAVAEVGAG